MPQYLRHATYTNVSLSSVRDSSGSHLITNSTALVLQNPSHLIKDVEQHYDRTAFMSRSSTEVLESVLRGGAGRRHSGSCGPTGWSWPVTRTSTTPCTTPSLAPLARSWSRATTSTASCSGAAGTPHAQGTAGSDASASCYHCSRQICFLHAILNIHTGGALCAMEINNLAT